MTKYKLFHPDTEIVGQVILDFQQATNSATFMDTFEKHGLINLEPETWYPGQKWVDVLNDIYTKPGAMMNFVSIGMRQIELAEMPLEFNEMPLNDVLISIEEAYAMSYRGTDIGSIKTQVVDDKHLCMIVRSFEPDDLWYGNIHGLLRRFGDPTIHYIVQYDPDVQRHDEGGEHTVFKITWD